jgi:hypothetical protein
VKFMLAVKNERLDQQRRIVAYLDSFSLTRDLRQARLTLLRELPSVPDMTFKGKL